MAVDNSEKIAALKDLRDSGLRKVTIDGDTTESRTVAQINSLIRTLEEEQGNTRRPKVSKLRIGGAW